MPTHRFSKPLSPSDAIDLFPQLLEELGITEPEEPFQYFLLEPELLDPENEADLVVALGFDEWISMDEASKSGDDDMMRKADMQHTIASVIRAEGFMLAEVPLDATDVYASQMKHDLAYQVYIARSPAPHHLNEYLADIAGTPDAAIKHKYKLEYPDVETQLSNLITLARMAEGAIRKIAPEGTAYHDAVCPDTEQEILTRAMLAAAEVWCRNGGDPNILVAQRSAQTIAALTDMDGRGHFDFEFGFLDPAKVEEVRQDIAYAILNGRKRVDSLDDHVPELPAKLPSTRHMIRHTAQLLNNLVDEQFDGDLNKHAEAIGVFARFIEGEASDVDRAAMELPDFTSRKKAHLALAMLTHLLDGYDSICNGLSNEQDLKTPRIMRRAFDHLDRYFDAAYDETQPTLPEHVRPVPARALNVRWPARPEDRSRARLERFKPDPNTKPN